MSSGSEEVTVLRLLGRFYLGNEMVGSFLNGGGSEILHL